MSDFIRSLTIASSQADMSAVRTEEWKGKTYTVVPVIAVVEGVLHGANSQVPELALASEFGKFPAAWNGRPVVMNHPQVKGVFVSASASHEVIEEYTIGTIYHTTLDDKRLRMEAWIDNEAVEALGGVAQETLDRINNGEVVDVSVGSFLDAVAKKGTHNGKQYGAVWANLAPDHLALLEAGVAGACSVADGCGTRVASDGSGKLATFMHVGPAMAHGACCDDCAKTGGDCSMTTAADAAKPEPTVDQAQAQEELIASSRRQEILDEVSQAITLHVESSDVDGLVVNAIAPDMVLEDVRNLVWQGLVEIHNVPRYDIYPLAITSDQVVYALYGSGKGLQAVNYSVGSDASVTFTGDPVPVNLLTRIVPRKEATTGISANEGKEQMPGENGTAAAAATGVDTSGAAAGTTPTVEAQTPAKVATFAELLEAADPAAKEMWSHGMAAYQAEKSALVESLLKVENCPFTKEQLDAKSVGDLKAFAALAKVEVPSYAGRGVPATQEGVNVNTGASANKPSYMQAPSNFLGKKQEVPAAAATATANS